MRSYLVLGLGRFGQALARALYEHGNEVMAVDDEEEIINEIQGDVTHAVIGDCKDEHVLKAIGARNFDVAIVAVGGDIQTSILTTVILKEMGIKHIVARALTELHSRILIKVGADRVVLPEHDMGIKLANSLSTTTNILDMIDISDEFSVVEIMPFKNWIGKRIQALDIREKHGINIIAVKKDEGVIMPEVDYVITENDILVIAGKNVDIERIR